LTVAEKLRAAGIDYEGTELEELNGAKVSEGNFPDYDVQDRLLQLESTVRILNQELSKLRPGGASFLGVRDRSYSISLDVSTTTVAGEATKASLSSSPSPWKKSLQRLDDGVGVRGSKLQNIESVQPDDAVDYALPASQKVLRASNVLRAAQFFETGQDEPDSATVHRSILTELYKIPQIKAIPSRDVEAAVRASVRLEGSPQQILMRKGDIDSFMIFTVIGSLCVKINDDSQSSEISSGSLVGSHAFLYKRPRSATVSCIGHCVYYRIDMNQPSLGSVTISEQPLDDSAAGLPPSSFHGIKHASDALQLAGRGTKPTVSTDGMTVCALPVEIHDRQSLIAPNTALGQC
jgi:hypothetical protein